MGVGRRPPRQRRTTGPTRCAVRGGRAPDEPGAPAPRRSSSRGGVTALVSAVLTGAPAVTSPAADVGGARTGRPRRAGRRRVAASRSTSADSRDRPQPGGQRERATRTAVAAEHRGLLVEVGQQLGGLGEVGLERARCGGGQVREHAHLGAREVADVRDVAVVAVALVGAEQDVGAVTGAAGEAAQRRGHLRRRGRRARAACRPRPAGRWPGRAGHVHGRRRRG